MKDKTVTGFLHCAFAHKNVVVSCLIYANSFYNEHKSWTMREEILENISSLI